MKVIYLMFLMSLFLFNTITVAGFLHESISKDVHVVNFNTKDECSDFDPLVDIELTVKILSIRALDDIDLRNTPDFFVNILVNSEKFSSPI